MDIQGVRRSKRLALDAAAMDFLRKNGLDFGRWISSGITYVNEETETALRAALEGEEAHVQRGEPLELTRSEDISFVESAMRMVDAMVRKKDRELVLPQGNNFRIRALLRC